MEVWVFAFVHVLLCMTWNHTVSFYWLHSGVVWLNSVQSMSSVNISPAASLVDGLIKVDHSVNLSVDLNPWDSCGSTWKVWCTSEKWKHKMCCCHILDGAICVTDIASELMQSIHLFYKPTSMWYADWGVGILNTYCKFSNKSFI